MTTKEILLLEYTLSEIEYMTPDEQEEISDEIWEEMKNEKLSDVLGFNR